MPDDKLARLQLRAKTDYLWLADEVLGYDFQVNPHRGLFNCFLQFDPEQKKTLPELDPEIKRRLILWHRGIFKTSSAAVLAIALILNFPDIRILIQRGNIPESKKLLEEIKGQFENWGADDVEVGEGKLHKLFPEFCSPVKGRKMGNSMRFVSPARRRKNLREPTLAVASPKTIKTGTHYDVIIIDDLVNDLNSKKPEQLQASINDYKAVVPVLAPDGYIFVFGTPYSFDDAYGWIEQQIKSEGLANWAVHKRTCWVTRCKKPTCDHTDVWHLDGGGPCNVEGCDCDGFESNGVREVLFPQFKTRDGRTEGFTAERLEAIRKEITDAYFACQYECNPLGAGQQKFTRPMIEAHLLPMARIPQRGPTVMQVDIAESESQTADDMVIYVSRIAGGRHHLIDCVSGHIPVEAQPVHICNLLLRYGPRAIFVEKKTGARYLERLVILEARARKIQHLPIVLVDADNTLGAKNARIGGLLGYYSQDRIKMWNGLPNLEKLIQQLLLWPKSQRRDDHADCLGLLLQSPTGFENMPLPPPQLPFWLRQASREAEQDLGERDSGLPFGING